MATRDVFSEEELGHLRGFPEIGRVDLIRHFTLTDAHVAFVGKFRPARNVLGAAVCHLPSVHADTSGSHLSATPVTNRHRFALDRGAENPLVAGVQWMKRHPVVKGSFDDSTDLEVVQTATGRCFFAGNYGQPELGQDVGVPVEAIRAGVGEDDIDGCGPQV